MTTVHLFSLWRLAISLRLSRLFWKVYAAVIPLPAVDQKKLLCQETHRAGIGLYTGILQTLGCSFPDEGLVGDDGNIPKSVHFQICPWPTLNGHAGAHAYTPCHLSLLPLRDDPLHVGI